MLSVEKKKYGRQHLVGNFTNIDPSNIKKRAKDIINILNTSGFVKNQKIGMSKFIEYQIAHFDNNTGAQEIKQFEQECGDLIQNFNKEYLILMQEISINNLEEDAIRRKNREFADRWREYKFT